MSALLKPFFLLVLRFVKNETVSGIIGNTHGISNAINPAAIPFNKICHQGSLADGSLLKF